MTLAAPSTQPSNSCSDGGREHRFVLSAWPSNARRDQHLRIVLAHVSILVVVQLPSLPLRLILEAVPVEIIHALGLGELVDLGAGEASEELLSEGVGDVLALLALVVLKGLEGGKGGAAGEELVAEAGLVVA